MAFKGTKSLGVSRVPGCLCKSLSKKWYSTASRPGANFVEVPLKICAMRGINSWDNGDRWENQTPTGFCLKVGEGRITNPSIHHQARVYFQLVIWTLSNVPTTSSQQLNLPSTESPLQELLLARRAGTDHGQVHPSVRVKLDPKTHHATFKTSRLWGVTVSSWRCTFCFHPSEVQQLKGCSWRFCLVVPINILVDIEGVLKQKGGGGSPCSNFRMFLAHLGQRTCMPPSKKLAEDTSLSTNPKWESLTPRNTQKAKLSQESIN